MNFQLSTLKGEEVNFQLSTLKGEEVNFQLSTLKEEEVNFQLSTLKGEEAICHPSPLGGRKQNINPPPLGERGRVRGKSVFFQTQSEKRGYLLKSVQLNKRKFTGGFTMTEVMIVVLILSILAVAGLPALNSSFDHARLSAAAEEVVSALQYAQLTAMTSGRKTRVIIGHLTNRIGVRQYTLSGDLFAGDNEMVASDVESGTYELMDYPLKKGTKYPILFDDEDRFKGVDITISDLDQTDPVDFDTLGSPSHGGTATLSLGGQQIVVTLDALTGKVSVSD